MGYNDYNMRKKRGKGVTELYELVDDIIGIEHNVDKLGYMVRKYYSKQLRKKADAIDDDYLCMTIECNHQLVNDAYESTLQYVRNPSLKEYFMLRN